ncbi:hypothetical protein F511_41982 [Dorcoceras hygrometricum]|uniref:Uncharacterized protein n=1 Tax=Dorcoceras hygrometricum TaxID=472368 RepID=A0A2Z7ANR5_9LAMI|nr:hypothetical protein F511_41982 [Dorcoceras hygrometricum]
MCGGAPRRARDTIARWPRDGRPDIARLARGYRCWTMMGSAGSTLVADVCCCWRTRWRDVARIRCRAASGCPRPCAARVILAAAGPSALILAAAAAVQPLSFDFIDKMRFYYKMRFYD